MVRCIAVRLRRRRGIGGCAPDASSHPPVRAFRDTRWNRSPGSDGRKTQQRQVGMNFLWLLLGNAVLATVILCGCAGAPGRPGPSAIPIDPDQISDFKTLYGQNCAGCHGTDGEGGAAIALGDPVYLAIANDSVLRGAATNGILGTSMPAFAKSAGGMLTD